MLKALLSALLLSCMAFAQVAQPSPSSAAPKAPEKAAELPPTAPVVTILGFCPDAPASTAKTSPECKTVITKAEFEKVVDTLNPKMSPMDRQRIAESYARLLVFAEDAKKRGLEDTPRYQELLKFARMQVAAQELVHTVQEQSKPTEAEIAKYYQDNKNKFEEISLKRIFIPRNTPNAKPNAPKPTDASLKAEGEKIRAELTAGGDFDKIEKQIYESKGYKTPPPPTSIPDWRREAVPPEQQSLFDLNQGELSPVIVEPAGAYIYKVEQKKVLPLDTVKAEIEQQLGAQNMREKMEAITSSVKPELNQAYFASFGPSRPGMIGPAGRPGREQPGAMAAPPAPQKPAAQKSTTPHK